MATIKAIEGRSVHQIQSGQVIVDLNSVVKELVENSLDAGATSIEIRFRNYGLDSLIVQDNGKGIAPEDFETVALKHHTSKLSNYDDLNTLDTFGFRGEALSSLCALSNFHILTARVEDGALGQKLDFETSGKLKSVTPSAAQKGTTAFVEDVFYNLPVRRKELEKNIKREYGKVLSLLYQYTCISVGVRIAVSNQIPKGKKVPVFSTELNTSTKQNIANVFGSKTLSALLEMDLRLELQPAPGPKLQKVRNSSAQPTDPSLEVLVQGHISKPVFGEGRQVPDRQMFFVNSRPCSLPQVAKAINEVYKSFNVSQSPFVFANLVMDTNCYDVNVSPDKRTIMLHDQTALLESLKAALIDLFEKAEQTMPQSSLLNRKASSNQSSTFQAFVRSTTKIATPDSEDGSRTPTTKGNERQVTDGVELLEQPPSVVHDHGESIVDQPERSISPETLIKKEPASPLFEGSKGLVSPAPFAIGPADEPQSPDAVINDVGEGPSTLLLENNGTFQELDSSSGRKYPLSNGVPGERHFVSARSLHRSSTNDQYSIPALTPGAQKSAPGPIQNAFDRMRPKRTPQQIAEITIGDVTTTTVIGDNPLYKKRRIHTPNNLEPAANQNTSLRLARGLRKIFAAPGSQLELDSGAFPDAEIRPTSKDYNADTSSPPNRSMAEAHEEDPIEQTPSERDYDTSTPLDDNNGEVDNEYIEEAEKKRLEDEKVTALVQEAELAATKPTGENLRRADQVLKNGWSRKDSPLKIVCSVETSAGNIEAQTTYLNLTKRHRDSDNIANRNDENVVSELDDTDAESRLSLTVMKSDFTRMQVVGQFNLGFILTTRSDSKGENGDDMFIVDQHAADEKYNYERLQNAITLQSQRLVRPKALELTAAQEEIVLNNSDALKANGFETEITTHHTPGSDENDDNAASRRQLSLLTLPMSNEKTFDLSDFEELLHLLSEQPAGSTEIPRPQKVQKILAMRACRSSIMVGKVLALKQMEEVVRHMGEMEKPWNCPHGRPTMRHLASLEQWKGWREDIGTEGTDWVGWLEKKK